MSKQSEMAIDHFMHDNKISSMALQETGTWTPSASAFKGRKIFSKSPDIQLGTSGVALIFDQSLSPETIDELTNSDIDAIWCQVKISGVRYLIGSAYCRPCNTVKESNKLMEKLLTNIESARKYRIKHQFNSMLVYGDFNARHLEWGDHKTNQRGQQLLSYAEKENITICSPYDFTFVCDTGGSVIDLVLAEGSIVNKLGQQWIEKDTELFSGAPRRGHYPILQRMDIQANAMNSSIPIKREDWKNGNWKDWIEEVEANCWAHQLQQETDGQHMWKSFLNIIKTANQRHIPMKIISVHSKPYWNSELSDLSKQISDARDKFKMRATPRNRSTLEDLTIRFKTVLIESKNLWIRERLEGMNITDSTQFWKNYKKIFGNKSDNFICNLKQNDVLISADKEKEKILFETFFTGKHLEKQPKDPAQETATENSYRNIKLNFANMNDNQENEEEDGLNGEIDIQDIKTAISKQKISDKACDSDGIHPTILNKLGREALNMLKAIFNWSLDNGKWLWNLSYVTFIRKEGKSSYMTPGAYRPITVSSYIGKILERIMDKRIRDIFTLEEFNDADQEGFMAGRSTTRYIFRLLANLEEVKRKRLACLILFLDFEKAFDSVHLPTLITKLAKFGLKGKILKLVHEFLFNRKICLRVNGLKGVPRNCTIFGLPQGAVLSPLFFIIYVQDMTQEIPEEAKSNLSCYKFADDGTLMVLAENMQTCFDLMQLVCNSLSKWCIRNKLVVNCDRNKTEAIILKTSTSALNNDPNQQPMSLPKLRINGKEIEYVQKTKVLGIILDDQLNFKEHALEKLKACNKKWAFITRGTNRNHGLNIRSLLLLLKATVLTKLLYAAPLWLKSNLDLYTGFWNRVLMKISGSMLYPQREITEIALHLPPLEIQLEVITAKFMSKILAGNDFLTPIIHQIDGTKKSALHGQILSLKRFLMWKQNITRGLQKMDISHPEYTDLAVYTKKEVQLYQQKIWLEAVENRIKHKKISAANEEKIHRIIHVIRSKELLLNNHNFLFRFNSDKRTDSFTMDFIHGNSNIFGHIREEEEAKKICLFCNMRESKPEHQLIECPEVQDNSYDQLISSWASQHQGAGLMTDILVPEASNSKLQSAFVKRIKFIIEQHDSIEYLSS